MDALSKAREACSLWLAMREHSRAELVHKLQGKGFDEAVIAEVVEEFAEDGLQNDSRFVESFVRSRYAKGHGPVQIRHELLQHGIGADELNQCLAQYAWDELLETVHRKKYGEGRPESPKDFTVRLRFLSQRGFEPDRIQALLRRLRRGDD